MAKRNLLKAILSPCIEFSLRHGLSIQEFIEVAKALYVQTAQKELERGGKSVTASAISIITGIRRGDVGTLSKSKPEESEPTLSVASRVLGHWRQNRRFRTKDRKPRVLTYKGSDSEFADLVKSVSKHVHPTSVLSELERMDAIEKTARGIRLKRETFNYSYNVEEGFSLLSKDIGSMLTAVEENMFNRQKSSNLHLRTEFDNITYEEILEIRRWLVTEGKAFHRRAREFLSKYDRDINPELGEGGEKAEVVLGAYSLTTPPNIPYSLDSDDEE